MRHDLVHARSQKLVDFAFDFAVQAHGNQKRKYTDEPYMVHPLAVARIVASRTTDVEAICAALLHDVLEDTPVTFEDLGTSGLWWTVARLVREVTDVSRPEDGNRASRKALDRNHLAAASDLAKTVKLADLLDNTDSITLHDPKFAKVYMAEKKLLLPVLVGGDPVLLDRANARVREWDGF